MAVKFTPDRAGRRAHQPEGGARSLRPEPGRRRHHAPPASTATAILPSFTTRRATTTVQLFDGQSFAIGGLIKNNVTHQHQGACRCWARCRSSGALFRSSDFQTDRTELVFIVTPHLVKPLPPDYPLPTDGYVPPSRVRVFPGRQDGRHARSAGKAPTGHPSGFELK